MSNNLTERLRVDAERWMSGDFGRDNEEAGMLSHEAAEEIAALRERVEAYRLIAVNQGWSHPLAAAYGHKEYLRQRIEEVDRKASRTVASGYDAAGYLRDGLAQQGGE